MKNTNSTKLKDSIFLDKHASASISGKDQKEIYTIILKDISKKYWSKFDKTFFPNYIDVELSQDPRGNVRIDWLVQISKDEVPLKNRTGTCSFNPSDYMDGWSAAEPVADCAFQNVGLLSVQSGYFVYGIESTNAEGPDLGLWNFHCRKDLNDQCVLNGPLCSTYYTGDVLSAAGTLAMNLDGQELNDNRIIVEDVSLDYAQSVNKVVLSICLAWNAILCRGSQSQYWDYECTRGYYTTIAAPGPEPIPTY